MRVAVALTTILLFCSFPCAAVEPFTEHTWRLSEGEARPDANLEDVAWLAGRWKGTGLGEGFEAAWMEPSAGSMVGFFKVLGEDAVAFYELLVISKTDGVLSLRVKHFTEDFVAWEEKEEFIEFKIVKMEKDAVHFGGISFYRRGPNEYDGYIVFSGDDGQREVRLNYQRVE